MDAQVRESSAIVSIKRYLFNNFYMLIVMLFWCPSTCFVCDIAAGWNEHILNVNVNGNKELALKTLSLAEYDRTFRVPRVFENLLDTAGVVFQHLRIYFGKLGFPAFGLRYPREGTPKMDQMENTTGYGWRWDDVLSTETHHVVIGTRLIPTLRLTDIYIAWIGVTSITGTGNFSSRLDWYT